jgi:D-hexose-6-phosphate mutarotase
MIDTDTLNRQYGIADQLDFVTADNGMQVARIRNSLAAAEIALQGAHLMTYVRHGEEPIIWVSPVAKPTPGKSIRGGVPVCWPWFGAHASNSAFPAHGFARTVNWRVVDSRPLSDGSTRVSFELPACNMPEAQWEHSCRVRLVITVGAELVMDLVTDNTGEDTFFLGEALHTYFVISDVDNVKVTGLDGRQYRDKVEGMALKQQSGAIGIPSEVDRVYLDTEDVCRIEDSGLKRAIVINKRGSRSTVVWNPWSEKAAKMGDFGSETGWRNMLCVESANAAENVVEVGPHGSHVLSVTYSSEPL